MIKMNLEEPCMIASAFFNIKKMNLASIMVILATIMVTELNLEEEENSLLTTVASLTDAHAVLHLQGVSKKTEFSENQLWQI